MFILIVILAMFCLVFFLASISEDDRHSSHSSNENFSSTPSSLQIEEHFSNDKTSKKNNPFIYPDTKNYPRIHTYKVKGKNPATNRQKTTLRAAREGTPADVVGSETYLLPPYTLFIDKQSSFERPASEAQIEYAKDLDIPIPSSPSLADMKVLISRCLNEFEGDYISPELYTLAGENGTQVSLYDSTENGICAVFASSSNEICLSFFCYFVYCAIHGVWPITAPAYSSHKAVFDAFAQKYIDKSDLIDTIRSMSYAHIKYMRTHNCPDKRKLQNIQAFSLASDFLSEQLPQKTFSSWEQWKSVHGLSEQIQRQCRSYDRRISLSSVNPSTACATVHGTGGRYMTSLASCTCPDFQRRRKPCKHMYRLAYELREKSPEFETQKITTYYYL